LAWWRKLTAAWRKKNSLLAQIILVTAQKNDFNSYDLQSTAQNLCMHCNFMYNFEGVRKFLCYILFHFNSWLAAYQPHSRQFFSKRRRRDIEL